jgi:hypothetical protein
MKRIHLTVLAAKNLSKWVMVHKDETKYARCPLCFIKKDSSCEEI